MKEIAFGVICFLLGVSTTVFLLTAARTSWSLWTDHPPAVLRGTHMEDISEGFGPVRVPQPSGSISQTDYTPLVVDASGCVRRCVPVRSDEQEPCVKACVYDDVQQGSLE